MLVVQLEEASDSSRLPCGTMAEVDFEVSLERLVQLWLDRSEGVQPLALRMPLADFLDEAVELAALVDQVVEPREVEGQWLPGLSQVFVEGELPHWETASEMRELSLVVSEVLARQASRRSGHRATALLREARLLRSEWFSILEFLFERQGEEYGVSFLREQRELARRQDLAAMRASFGALAPFVEAHCELLPQVGMAPEDAGAVRRMWERLDQHRRDTAQLEDRRREEQRVRGALLRLLDERVSATRRAIRFVFRHHPDVLNKAQSDYARNKRRQLAARNARLKAPHKTNTVPSED